MKKWFLPALVWIYFPTFAQEVVRVNFNDSCIIQGGQISKKDFLKMLKICHPQLKEVKSFNIIVILSGEEKNLHYNGNRWDPKLFKSIPAGTRIYFEEIKGLSPQGNFTKGSDIMITIN